MGDEEINRILFIICIVIAAILFFSTLVHVTYQKHWKLTPSRLTAVATALFVCKTIVAYIHFEVRYLNAPARFVLLFGTLNSTNGIIFYLYYLRLRALADNKRFGKPGLYAFCALLGLYAIATLCMLVIYGMQAYTTPTGGYAVRATGGTAEVKFPAYLLEVTIALLVFLSTIDATMRVLAQNAKAGLTSISNLYLTIIRSDAFFFTIVFAITLFKAITSFNINGNVGVLPAGNLGFQHLLDAVKVAIMVINLYLPSAFLQLRGRVMSDHSNRNTHRTSVSKAPVTSQGSAQMNATQHTRVSSITSDATRLSRTGSLTGLPPAVTPRLPPIQDSRLDMG